MHPWFWIEAGPSRWFALVASGLLSLSLMAYLSRQGASLEPNIVRFELAWTQERASRILRAWGSDLGVARRQVRIDFLLLVAYPLAFSLACAMLADGGGARVATTGVVLSWAVLVAGPLDAVENLALLRMLDRGAEGTMALLASVCASVKFAIVIAALIYLAVAGLLGLMARGGGS